MLLLELSFKVTSIVKYRSVCLIKYICIYLILLPDLAMTSYCNTEWNIWTFFTWAECYGMFICFYIWGKTRISFLETWFWIYYEKLTWCSFKVVDCYFKFCSKLITNIAQNILSILVWHVKFFQFQTELCRD